MPYKIYSSLSGMHLTDLRLTNLRLTGMRLTEMRLTGMTPSVSAQGPISSQKYEHAIYMQFYSYKAHSYFAF